MTTPHNHSPDGLSESLPSDLVPIARALDRLAAFDAAAMPHDLCERIAAATVSTLIAHEALGLDALSTSDRAAAPSTLEDRVFMATRALITKGAQQTARVHEQADRSEAARPRRAGVLRRVAIAAGLVLAVGLTIPLLRTTNSSDPSGTSTAVAAPQLASAIQSDLDELASFIDTTDTRNDVLGLNVALRSVEDAIDDDPLRTAIDDGGAL